jgi:DNA-binding GntR family transcriptional regulator
MSTGSLAHALRVPVAVVGTALAALQDEGLITREARLEGVGPRSVAECYWALAA